MTGKYLYSEREIKQLLTPGDKVKLTNLKSVFNDKEKVIGTKVYKSYPAEFKFEDGYILGHSGILQESPKVFYTLINKVPVTKVEIIKKVKSSIEKVARYLQTSTLKSEINEVFTNIKKELTSLFPGFKIEFIKDPHFTEGNYVLVGTKFKGLGFKVELPKEPFSKSRFKIMYGQSGNFKMFFGNQKELLNKIKKNKTEILEEIK